VLDETSIVHALGKTSVQDNIDTDNSTSISHQPSDRGILPSSSPAVQIDDVMDENYSEIDEELATLTEEASALTTPAKGKKTRPSSRRGQTQTSVHITAELFMKHIIYENGICIEIVSDRDSKFTSKMWHKYSTYFSAFSRVADSARPRPATRAYARATIPPTRPP
jgi:hypothetical protein